MTAVDWLDSLSPWPREFGLERMQALLTELGNPQNEYPAVHVVGTNGKSTAAVTIEQLLLSEELRVGTTISPHVESWSERIRIDGSEIDFEQAIDGVREPALQVGATQFEIVTAAALAAFAEAGIDVAVVEAGLGGRLDATNVLNARVVLLTNVALEHTDVLGDTLEQIAREKLAVAEHASIVVLPDETHAHLVDGSQVVLGGARAAAEAFVGHPIAAEPVVSLAGRFEQRDSEVRDGAHNPDGMRYLVNRLRGSEPQGTAPDYTVVTSILADKDADAMLRELRQVASRLVATSSSSDRALSAAELAQLARPHFDRVEAIADPVEALARGHELGEPVLVAGSLYLLGDLAQAEQER